MNTRILSLTAVSALAFAVAGCGSSSSSGGGAAVNSCVIPVTADVGYCFQFNVTGLSTTQIATVQAACTSPYTYSTSACPSSITAGKVLPGFCSIPQASLQALLEDPTFPVTAAQAYLYGAVTIGESKTQCTTTVANQGFGGTWTDATSGVASCTQAAANLCIEFAVNSLTSAQVSQVQTLCTNQGLAFASSRCTATNAVAGFCLIPSTTIEAYLPGGLITQADGYFYTPAWNAAGAQTFCETPPGTTGTDGLGGTWF